MIYKFKHSLIALYLILGNNIFLSFPEVSKSQLNWTELKKQKIQKDFCPIVSWRNFVEFDTLIILRMTLKNWYFNAREKKNEKKYQIHIKNRPIHNKECWEQICRINQKQFLYKTCSPYVLSYEFSCIELVIQWTICGHIVG